MEPTTRKPPRATILIALAVLAGTLASSLAPVSSGDDATQPLGNGFESGDFTGWAVVKHGADGSAGVETSLIHDGRYAARLSDSAADGSYAYARADLATPQTDLTVDGFFQVLQEGEPDSNVPLLRFFDTTGARQVSVYRLNQRSNELWVQHSDDYFRTTGALPLNTWGELTVHIVTAGPNAGLLEVWLDGASIYRTTTATLRRGIASVQIGNEVPRQTFALVADSLSVRPTPPEAAQTPRTTITSGPSGASADTNATFAFTADEPATFMCQLDAGPPAPCSSPQTYANLANGPHQFSVQASDAAGAEPTPVTRSWTVDFPCAAGAPAPTTSDPGAVVVADNFESNTLSQWTVTAEGGATATVTQQAAHDGNCAAELHVTAGDTSRANLVAALPPGTHEVWADGWFNIQREGSDSSSNVPTFRFFSGGNRVLDISRQNDKGDLFVRYPKPGSDWTIASTGQTLTLNQWHHLKVHVIANGAASTVEVWLDDVEIYATTSATLGVTTLDQAGVGAEHRKQDGDFAADDIVIKALGAPGH